MSSGVSQDASTEAHPAEPTHETPALQTPAPRVGPGLVDEDAAIDPSKLVYESLLGRGAFGEVHYGSWAAPDGIIHEVAIKVLLATRYGSLKEHEQVCWCIRLRLLPQEVYLAVGPDMRRARPRMYQHVFQRAPLATRSLC